MKQFSFLLGMAIFDTMKHIRPDVSTVCIGLAARYWARHLKFPLNGQQLISSYVLNAMWSLIALFFTKSLGFSSCLNLDPNLMHLFHHQQRNILSVASLVDWSWNQQRQLAVFNRFSSVVLKLPEAHLIFGTNWNFQSSMICPVGDFGLMSCRHIMLFSSF
jgi:signal transduction histidine kinase